MAEEKDIRVIQMACLLWNTFVDHKSFPMTLWREWTYLMGTTSHTSDLQLVVQRRDIMRQRLNATIRMKFVLKFVFDEMKFEMGTPK